MIRNFDQDPSLSKRLLVAGAALALPLGASACSSDDTPRGGSTIAEQVAESKGVDLSSIPPPETHPHIGLAGNDIDQIEASGLGFEPNPEQRSYYEWSDRNMRLHGEVSSLVYAVQNLDYYVDSVDFERSYSESEGGLTFFNYTTTNTQGDLVSISISGEPKPTDVTYEVDDKFISAIQPDNISISMIPEEHVGKDFYNYSSDVGFKLDESGHYITTLRTEAAAPDGDPRDRSIYYTVRRGYTLIDTVVHEVMGGGSDIDTTLEIAEAVDARAIERARQIIFSIPTEDSPLDFSFSPELDDQEVNDAPVEADQNSAEDSPTPGNPDSDGESEKYQSSGSNGRDESEGS